MTHKYNNGYGDIMLEIEELRIIADYKDEVARTLDNLIDSFNVCKSEPTGLNKAILDRQLINIEVLCPDFEGFDYFEGILYN